MKKIYLLLVVFAVLILNSCSNDDESSASKSISFKVDGVSKKFVVQSEEIAGLLFISGYLGNPSNPIETVSFTIDSGVVGANTISNFSYENTTDTYEPGIFNSNVSENSGGNAKGTFSGTLEPFETNENVVITDGSFTTN